MQMWLTGSLQSVQLPELPRARACTVYVVVDVSPLMGIERELDPAVPEFGGQTEDKIRR